MVLVLLSSFFVCAFPAEIEEEFYTLEGDEVPSEVNFLFGNQRMNIYVLQADGTEEDYSMITEEGVVVSVSDTELEDPTLTVHTFESSIELLMTSEDQFATFQELLETGAISYEAHGFFNSLKFSFGSILSSIAGIFS